MYLYSMNRPKFWANNNFDPEYHAFRVNLHHLLLWSKHLQECPKYTSKNHLGINKKQCSNWIAIYSRCPILAATESKFPPAVRAPNTRCPAIFCSHHVIPLQHKSNLETLLYRYFIICLYKYVIIYCKDTFCGTLESVTCIKTLFEAF